jgi:hypothetical protein
MASRRLWIVEKPLWWFGRQTAKLWRWAAGIWSGVLKFLRHESTSLAILCLYSVGGAISLFRWPASREWLGLYRLIDVALLAIFFLWAVMFLVWTHKDVRENLIRWLPAVLSSPLWIWPFLVALVVMAALSAAMLAGSLLVTPVGGVAMLAGLAHVWWRRRRGITLPCTYSDCLFGDLDLRYLCPDCGTGYACLIPSHLGLLYHKCSCGTRLPALRWLRRRRAKQLKLVCPRNHPLELRDDALPARFVALAGGTSAGKTCYLEAVVAALLDPVPGAQPPPSPFSGATPECVPADWEDHLPKGQTPRPTQNVQREATVLRFAEEARSEWRLFLFDPSGEIFSALQDLPFFVRLTGIMVLVDPLGLPGLRHLKTKYQQLCKVSSTSVDTVFATLRKNVSRYLRYGRSRRIEVPVAVVIAKTDIPEVADVVGRPAIEAAEEAGIKTEHDLCKGALIKWGMDAEIVNLEKKFSRVRYFSCSALGRIPYDENQPEDRDAYHGDRVLPPLLWLLNQEVSGGTKTAKHTMRLKAAEEGRTTEGAVTRLLPKDHPWGTKRVSLRAYFIALVGGICTGKTCYMRMVTEELLKGARAGLALGAQFESAQDRQAHQDDVKILAEGMLLAPTQSDYPRTALLSLQGDPRGLTRLYLYNAAGEIYSHLQEHKFFEDATGILFFVDPLALPKLHEQAATEHAAEWNDSLVSGTPVEVVFASLRRSATRFMRYGADGRTDVPAAVVISKANVNVVDERVGPRAVQKEAAGRPLAQEQLWSIESDLCRRALMDWGMANEIRALESQFRQIAYFACSPLGRTPDKSGKPYVADRVLPPLLWLLNRETSAATRSLKKASTGG